MSASIALSAIDDHWINTTGGTWDVSGNWDQGSAPTSTTYDAIIDLQTSNSYEIDIVDSFSNAGITLNSANATIVQNTGTVTTPFLNLNAGTFLLGGGERGGVLSGATINLNGGTLNLGASGGIFDNITLGSDLSLNANAGPLYVTSGLTLSNTTLTLNDNNELNFDNETESIGGSGTINLAGNGAAISNLSGQITLGSGINVVASTANSFNLGSYNAGSITTNGTVSATNGSTLAINTGTLTNNGLLSASGASTLVIGCATFTNNGTISADSGGTVSINAFVNASQLGNFTTNGGAGVVQIGSGGNLYLDNPGINSSKTLTLSDILTLNGGAITGGVVATNGAGSLVIGPNGGLLDGVTLTGGDLQLSRNEELIVQNGLSIIGHNLDVASGAAVYFDGDAQTISNLSIAGATQAEFIVGGNSSTGPATLTLDNSTSITGGFYFEDYSPSGGTLINNGTLSATDNTSPNYNGYIGDASFTNNGLLEASTGTTVEINSGSFLNNGTVAADGGAVSIDAGSWSNTGVFTAAGGTLNLGGSFSTAGIGSIVADSASTIQITGIDDNTNATLTPLSGNWILNGGTITGGTIDQSTQPLSFFSGTINGVTVTGGDMQVPSGAFLAVETSLTVTNHNLDLADQARILFDDPNFTASNLNISVPSGTGYVYIGGLVNSGEATLTLAASTTVTGGVHITGFSEGDLINDGTFNSNNSGSPADINVFTLANNGLIEATAGAVLSIEASDLTNNGTLETGAGSTLTISAANFIQNGTLIFDGGVAFSNSMVNFDSGVLQTGTGGSLVLSGTTTINQSGTATANIQGPFVIAPAAGDTASYNLSGGVLTAQESVLVGPEGSGAFTQTGGSATITGVLSAGNEGTLGAGTGNGIINISGGDLRVDTILLGSTAGGTGDMTVSGTANVTVSGGAHLNDLNVNGGTFTVLDQDPPASEDPELNRAIVGGYLTNGALNVNGGAVVSPMLKLGITGKTTGTFTESSGTVTLQVLSAGNDGTLTTGSGNGIVNISGGSLYADTVLLGSTDGGHGDMTLSGTANVTVSGGAHLNDLNINGGAFTVLDQDPPADEDTKEDPELNRAIVGGYLTNGALNLTAGVVNAPLLKLGITSQETGTFTETGGSGSFTILSVGSDGTLTSGSGVGIANISGGSLYATTVLLGSTAGGTGDMTISGTADVTIGGGAHLNDLNVTAGNLSVLNKAPMGEDPELNYALVGGYLTNGALNVSGGLVTTPYIKLGISSGFTGAFSQTAGTVRVGTLCIGNDVTTSSGSGSGVGIANLSGGTLSVGTILLSSTAGGVGSINISGTAAVEVTHSLTALSDSHFAMTGGSLTFDPGAVFVPADPCIIGNGSAVAEVHLHNATVSSAGLTLTIGTNGILDGGGSAVVGTTGSALFSTTSLTLTNNATLHLALGGDPSAAKAAGVTYDQITQSGGVFTVGGATLQILPLSNVMQGEKYPVVIATNGGSIDYSHPFSNLNYDPQYTGSLSYSVAYSSTEIDVTFGAVPEPASAMLLAVGGLLLRRRRSHRGRLGA